jgi:sensor histidine kinase YesM
MPDSHTLKHNLRYALITAVLNTSIAFILSASVYRGEPVTIQLICSNLIGFSIFACMRSSDFLYVRKKIGNPVIVKGIALSLGIIIGSLSSWIYLSATKNMTLGFFLKNVLLNFAVFGILFGLPIVYYFSSQRELIASRQQVQDEKIRRLTIEKEAAMTSLRLLQAQIEPHFLFNTLSTVLSLFETDVEKAKMMLLDLNIFLRGCLDSTRKRMITLEKELEITAHYMNIFKIRMGTRLTYSIQNQTGLTDLPFPPLIIQPLVENSIKYGLEPKPEGGTIYISCRYLSSTLEIIIEDTGLGLENDVVEPGIGLDNVSRRLESIYGDNVGLFIEPVEPVGTRVTIRIKQ